MIIANDLHKSFKTKTGTVRAVDGVHFEARDGEITGLLGPNGAGKTTTLRMLYTLMKPDVGQVLDACEVSAANCGNRGRKIPAVLHEQPLGTPPVTATAHKPQAVPERVRGLGESAHSLPFAQSPRQRLVEHSV